MNAPTETQLELLQAADAGRLTISGLRFYIDRKPVTSEDGWTATDMLKNDPLLFIPEVSKPAKHKPVHPTVRGLAVLHAAEVPQ